MKKLNSLLLLVLLVIVSSCGGDDDNSVVTSFEGKLTAANSYFQSSSQTLSGGYYTDHFKDNQGLLTFDHYYSIYGSKRYYAGFTYTNSSDVTTGNSTASICGKGKVGNIYLNAYCSDYSPAVMTINNTTDYCINGCWVSNSVYAYNCMTTSDWAPATKFKANSYYMVTAYALDSNGNNIKVNGKALSASIYLAKYTKDSDLPSKVWQWFDLTSLSSATKIKFSVSSSDTGTYGVNTDVDICIDGIKLDKK
jgi:hypothetical protein